MTIEKIMQRLDRIEEALEKLFTLNLTQNKKFLTLEEVKEKADYWHEYKKGVYVYKKDGKWTLIEKGEVLIDGADWAEWYADGVYDYKKDGKWTLIENGKVLVDGVDWVYWYEPGVYRYKKDNKWFEVKDGITTRITTKI
jgi:hypothetical protein